MIGEIISILHAPEYYKDLEKILWNNHNRANLRGGVAATGLVILLK